MKVQLPLCLRTTPYGLHEVTEVLILKLDEEVVNFPPRTLYPREKKPWHPLYRTLGGHWGRYGLLEGENHLLL